MWYKDAIIYELHVKCFFDSSGDGIGDLKGLTEKLDYLQDLGVTAIWILPFYPSPLRDDGYDIADYMDVNHQYGNLQDFKVMLKEAHKRGLRVITELVVNHTSDQHAWFQRARTSPKGSKFRNYYVWSDTPQLYNEARIIFQDFESSNWTWDAVAGQYYWHRFYSHQPDLNFENPEVHKSMYHILDFWFKMGVDGVRLDAVPYLYEEDGTICENLPRTHQFLKNLRAHVDQHYTDKMILAEANQWPEDAAKYFGTGDECHMAFHFPVMPRLFMSIHLEDALPIIEIMRQTPKIPENSQWALFLRNHDELTLEMVTDEERDYMFRVYAHDPQARLNLGIRRRLAPLLKNDRRKIELMNSLLFSLIGTPVLYYGDELGMGDNIYLGDRNGVRTPMQWSNDRNAGFSRANPQKLYLPPIIDPEYHYETVNVEAQSSNPYSLFWWTKQLIALRKRFEAFGSGETHFLVPKNRKVLVFFREYKRELIMIVANLSRFPQFAELNLPQYEGYQLIELFSGEKFPSIGQLPYFLTLGPYGYYWFALEKEPQESILTQLELQRERQILDITVEKDEELLFLPEKKGILEQLLTKYLFKRFWFKGNVSLIDRTKIHLADHFLLAAIGRKKIHIVVLSAVFTTGEAKQFVLFLNFVTDDKADEWYKTRPQDVVAKIKLVSKPKKQLLLCDVSHTKTFSRMLLDVIQSEKKIKGHVGQLQGVALAQDREAKPLFDQQESLVVCREEDSIAVPLEDGVLKIFTFIEDGMAVDVEMRLFLTKKTNFKAFLPLLGYIEYKGKNQIPLALAEEICSYQEKYSAEEIAINAADRFLLRMETMSEEISKESLLPDTTWVEIALGEIPVEIPQVIEQFIEMARHLGKRTAEFHLAIASGSKDSNFAPIAFARFYQRSLYQNLRRKVSEALIAAQSDELKMLEPIIQQQLSYLGDKKIKAMRTRHHGNYILQNLCYTGTDFLITNFEGNRKSSFSERRYKSSPLNDVASMLLSFMECSYTAVTRLQARGQLNGTSGLTVYQWANSWATWVGSSFLRAYLKTLKREGGTFLPEEQKDIEYLLHISLIEKCMEKLILEKNKAALNMLLHWLPKYTLSS